MTDSRNNWPVLLREIAEELGDAAAFRLVTEYGGQRVYVPGVLSSQPDSQSDAARRKFTARLGDDLADYLIRYHGGDKLTVPTFAQREAEDRRKYVLQNPGLSANTIAKELGIHVRRVEQIRQAAREKSNQPSLF